MPVEEGDSGTHDIAGVAHRCATDDDLNHLRGLAPRWARQV